MSGAKRELEHLEDQRRAAIGIAVDAGVLKPCEFHPDVLLQPELSDDYSSAYRLGNFRLSRGDFNGLFRTPREMTDAVKAAIDAEGVTFGCPRCFNSLRD